MKNWRMPFTRGDIREWGAARRMVLLDDRGPVVDGMAAYVGPFGSSILVNGLSREKRYRLWIDFVRFRIGPGYPGSVLKITAAGPGMEPRMIDTIRSSDIKDYYHVDIPVDVSARGSAEIDFTELSAVPGNWGVWDIIVAVEGELPRRSDIPGDDSVNLDVNDRIVQ